jgi:RNA polymerase sigma factor (TIGR02999 family)
MSETDRSVPEITAMLQAWGSAEGDNREALDALMPIVYDELRRQAHRFLRREDAHHTLQTTALVHEAYLKLIDQRYTEWESRSQFFALVATIMRRILVDYAKTKHRQKRGGAGENLPLEEAFYAAATERNNVDLLALDEALKKLEEFDPRKTRLVELKFFVGLSLEETAELLDVSMATVKRDWQMAKAWLHRELTRETNL